MMWLTRPKWRWPKTRRVLRYGCRGAVSWKGVKMNKKAFGRLPASGRSLVLSIRKAMRKEFLEFIEQKLFRIQNNPWKNLTTDRETYIHNQYVEFLQAQGSTDEILYGSGIGVDLAKGEGEATKFTIVKDDKVELILTDSPKECSKLMADIENLKAAVRICTRSLSVNDFREVMNLVGRTPEPDSVSLREPNPVKRLAREHERAFQPMVDPDQLILDPDSD